MQDNFYPSIDTLSKLANEQSVALSLRIKESTRSLFDALAKQNNTTVSALANSILDHYATRYIATNQDQAALNRQTLRRYAETVARKAGALDPETLLRDTIIEYHPEALFEESQVIFPLADEEKLIRDFGMWAKGLPTHFFNQKTPFVYIPHGVVHATDIVESARIDVDYSRSANELTQYGITKRCIDVYLPAQKWIIVVNIFFALQAKIHELLKCPMVVGETALRNIIYLANSVEDNAEFAKLVMQIILQENLPSEQPNEPKVELSQASQAPPQTASSKKLEWRDLDVTVLTSSNKLTWADIAVAALEQLGGVGKTTSIYRACKEIANTLGKPITHKNEHSFNMSIQGTLETCSRDCNPDVKKDYFSISEKGSGIWRLNRGVHFDWNLKRAISTI